MSNIDYKNSSDKGSDSEGTAAYSDDSSVSTNIRICKSCGTKKTPLWRSGPQGPKSLCNACGIKSKKKEKSTDLGLNDIGIEIEDEIENENENENPNENAGEMVVKKDGCGESSSAGGGGGGAEEVKKLISEEEQAALLLICMSRGLWDE